MRASDGVAGAQLAEEALLMRSCVLFPSRFTENTNVIADTFDCGVAFLPKAYRAIDLARKAQVIANRAAATR